MAKKAGSIRVIGGQWRGRRLPVAQMAGLRPSSDRIRETLFNWLQPVIVGARCLDLFAGSGALGFEAASRGAATVTLVEQDRRLCRQLEANCQSLHSDGVRVVQADALAWLGQDQAESYDVVFIDPPFAAELHTAVCAALQCSGVLDVNARLYLECGRGQIFTLPEAWELLRDKQAGSVRYRLFAPRGC